METLTLIDYFATFLGIVVLSDWASSYLKKWLDSNSIWSTVISWITSALVVALAFCLGKYEVIGVFSAFQPTFYWYLMISVTFICSGLLSTGRVALEIIEKWINWISNIPVKK